MNFSRRRFMQLAGGVAATGIPQFAHALDYQTRPVRVIVGFPPGGSADIVTRIVAQALSERLGQSLAVDDAGPSRTGRRLAAGRCVIVIALCPGGG